MQQYKILYRLIYALAFCSVSCFSITLRCFRLRLLTGIGDPRHFAQTNTSGTWSSRIRSHAKWIHVQHWLHSIMGRPAKGCSQKHVTRFHDSSSTIYKNYHNMNYIANPFQHAVITNVKAAPLLTTNYYTGTLECQHAPTFKRCDLLYWPFS